MRKIRSLLLSLALLTAPSAFAQILPSDPSILPFALPSQQVPQEENFLEGRLLDLEAFSKAAEQALRPRADSIRILKRPAPFYPYRLVRTSDDPENPGFKPVRDAGSAEIALLVGTDGKGKLASIRNATRDSFGLTAAEAALQWEFEPLISNGLASEFQVVIPFTFKPVDESQTGTGAIQGDAGEEAPPKAEDVDIIRLPLP